MIMRRFALLSTCLVATLLALAPFAGSSAPPPAGQAPKNLRVTGVTDWTVGLRWDPPRGRTPAAYVVQCSNGHSMTVPGSQTTATFSSGFDYNRTYSFRAYAVLGGAWSGPSNQVTATLLPDTTPPTQPIVSATGSGPTHIDLAWSCFDACPTLRFDIYVNDVLRHVQVAGNAKVILVLQPNTAYTFKVRARDSGGNWSAMSEPFTVATPPADPNDHEPPTMPPSLWGGIIDGQAEAMVFWGHSTDNVTSQDFIEYFVYLNGGLEEVLVGTFHNHQSFLYLTPGILNTIEVRARDEAGNWSAPATMTIDMRSP
jgi:chitodextrinase